MTRPLYVEIFPCSGGMAEGFRRAGIVFAFAFDKDPNACASYEHNHGHRPIRIDVRDLLRMARAGWRPGPIRLLVADPPCTPWSRAGKRLGTEDERDCLRETAELISILLPDAYLIGNVPGLQDSSSWHVVQDVIGGLSVFGYCVADYAQLDAADYGVPQHRIRPFWYGHRGGACIRWPARTHGSPVEAALPTLPGIEPLRPWVTCRDALSHLPIEELGRPVRLKRDDPKHPPCSPDEPGTTVRSGGNGNAAPHVVLANGRHPPAETDAPADGVKLEWPWDRPSTTVAADPRIPPPGHHDGGLMSGPNAVILSERAAAILQGFPEGWLFSGDTKKARWSQIGQAMPPGLAEPVARAIVEQLAGWEPA